MTVELQSNLVKHSLQHIILNDKYLNKKDRNFSLPQTSALQIKSSGYKMIYSK